MTLSPNNNITDSIRRHGVSDKTTELIVIRIESEAGDEEERQAGVWKEIEEVCKGRLVSLDELEKGDKTDWSRVDKVS